VSAMRERVQPILAIVRRDLRQIHRHGLATLLVLTVLLFFLGIVGFIAAGALGIAWAVIALRSGKL